MICIERLTKNFKDCPALENIDLQVERGSIFGLVGPNGAGKTTLLRTIMGILLPTRGQVLIDGHNIHLNPGIKSRIGYVADYQSYYSYFKVQEMIGFYRRTYDNWCEERFTELFSIFNLPLNKSIKSLSKGMRTQLAILLNLSIRPAVLLLDEPTSGLDPVLRRQLLNILMDEVARNQTTVFTSTHNLGELERVCDRIGIIHEGRLIFNESLEDMKQRTRKIQVAFSDRLPEEFFQREDILKVEGQGRVYNLVVRDNVQEVMDGLRKYQPLLLETIDMSLEDIFIYRMGGVGYGFEQIFAQ